MYATYVIWTRHMRKFVQQTEELFGLALQSVLWVVLFGVGMRGMIGAVGGNDYMSFILPGIIALSALGGAVGGGMVLLDERLRGIVKEYLAAPIPRLSILLGSAASTATKALFQAALMLVVGLLMGARLSVNPIGWLGALALLAVFAIGFSGLALGVAAISRSIAGYHGMIFLFNLPLLFASNALYPLDVLPGWMRVIVLINPATYFIDAVRALAFGTAATLPLWLSGLILIGFAVLSMMFALTLFQRSLRA
ncbi:MAG: transport permease protein [Chloroflexus sp.]|jgi:ABC-2 type transport system permease protein|uniref:Transport permease protein n=1 Tax=Chloroflexus aurantiacus (strain ATCC 29366 / DSM 635 / J-10-fl) TaxID=324602 RepID=A9WBJ2_CHLAA|nr:MULTISPECIES: ABC transporter permease [Chloroflexus]RMG46557.1 MAG: ABC transporter [Chloroflexota bacterium]ABY33399.1 ABC-2 type transporter [Chloroflexus aurantiacus J-10-fl]GIV86766.1 MAG: transport permease protein [Chloroflexus sp.]GIV92937.1 MAG: transport permease protein [Chloroflexus sp.]HBW66705.1 ABC transporter [Chloroflexus aurantiacus]